MKTERTGPGPELTYDSPFTSSDTESPAADEHLTSTAAEEQDGGYGWVCVVAQLLITASTWGVNGSFGVYLAHYLGTDTFSGTSEIAYAFIGGLSQCMATLTAPLVTYSIGKMGTKPTLFIGIALETGALIGASFATQAWHLFVTQGLVFGWGSAFLYIGTIGIIPQWFTKRRGVAGGIAGSGSGIGGMVYSLASEAMIADLGVAWSFRITAICAAVVNIICALLIRDRNKDIIPQQHGFNLKLLKQPALLCILGWAILSIFGYTIIMFSLPDNGISVGLTAQQGAVLVALGNAGMAVGRPVVGLLSDRYGRVTVVTAATALAAIWCLCLWTSGKTYAILIAASLLGGSVMGTSWASIAPLLADTFGTKLLPSALSVVWTLISIPSLFAEAIALSLRRRDQPQYLHIQIFTGCMFVGSAIILAFLPLFTRPKNKPSAG